MTENEHHEHHAEHLVHHAAAAQPKRKIKKTLIWQGISLILAVALVWAIYTGGFNGIMAKNAADSSQNTAAGAQKTIILNDQRCGEACNTAGLESQLKSLFPEMTFEHVDYNTEEGKKLYADNKVTTLPVVLLNADIKTAANFSQVQNYVDQKKDGLQLRIPASFDPNAEICGNEKDDNGDGKIDCDDEKCKTDLSCNKKDKPVVEVFVMSHCPYGTQIEKGVIPAAEALGDKIDFSIKFCDYAMHGEKELKEEMQQYCIQEEQNDKFFAYLKCFLKEGNSESCVTEAKVDKTKLDACITATDEKFSVMKNFADKATYRGNFPPFAVYADLAKKYGVQGSPTLIVNGADVSSNRDSVSLLKAICAGFKTAPSECSKTLDSAQPSPGFGTATTAAATADAGCAS
jgi:thioredoxin-related protein